MVLQTGGGSGIIANSAKQREHKNAVPNNRASLLKKVVEWLHSTFGTRICSRLTGLNSEGKGDSSMASDCTSLLRRAAAELSTAGAAYVEAGNPKRGEIRDRYVNADRKFRAAYYNKHGRLPVYSLDESGRLVLKHPIYIDHDGIRYGHRTVATNPVPQ